MKKIALLAAATIGASLLVPTASVAQPALQFGIGPDGRPQIGVRDPQREELERRERWRQRRDEDRVEAYEQGRRDAERERRRYGETCRNITIEEEDRRGRMVTRQIRRCD